MEKKKKRHKGHRPPVTTERAARAIQEIARRDGTAPEMVRKHIQLAMLNGLISDDPKVQAEWAKIPRAGEIPTPEEVIAFVAGEVLD